MSSSPRGRRSSASSLAVAVALSLVASMIALATDLHAAPQGGATPRGGEARPQAMSADAQAMTASHNQARAKHCATPLRWSAELARIAQRWADTLANRGCAFDHSRGTYGENLAAGSAGMLDPSSVVRLWYDEVSQYRFPDGGFSMQTGHFTQLVWRATTALGCGRSRCKGMDIWVCEYAPAGNVEGEYRQNVLPRSCSGNK